MRDRRASFYPESDGEPRSDFKQESNLITFACQKEQAGWEPVAGKDAGGTDGHRFLLPLCHSLPLFASQTQFPTPPGARVRGGREEGESRTFLSVRRCRELGTASLGLPGVMGCLGSTFPLRVHRSWLPARASPSQLIACSFLSSWESGNREGKPSLVRPVRSSLARRGDDPECS